MSVTLTTPITGTAQTGFTAPTYTIVGDIAPDINGKQWAVTALGGTQAGVSVHSGSDVFTIMVSKPRVFKALGKPNPTTGVVSSVPMNVYKTITRKGMLPLANQAYATGMIRTEYQIPAGADTYSPSEIRAMASCHFGALSQQSAGFGDTLVSGIL